MLTIQKKFQRSLEGLNSSNRIISLGNFVLIFEAPVPPVTGNLWEEEIKNLYREIRPQDKESFLKFLAKFTARFRDRKFNACLCFFSREQIFSFVFNGGSLKIQRSGETIIQKNYAASSNLVIGKLKPKDIILLTTATSQKNLPLNLTDYWKNDQGVLCLITVEIQKFPLAKLLNSLTTFPNFLKFDRLAFDLRTKQLFLKSDQNSLQNRRKVFFSIGIILLLLSLSAAFFIVKTRKEKEKLLSNNAALAVFKIEEGQNLLDISKERSLKAFAEANDLLSKEQKLCSFSCKKINELLQKTRKLISSAKGVVVISEPLVFLNLNLVKDQAKISKMSLWGSEIAILDTLNNLAYKINLVSKQSEITKGQLVGPKSIALSSKKIYVLESLGIDKLHHGFDWPNISELYYYGESIYLLDTSARQIWKIGADLSESGKKPFFASNISPDLSQATSLTIDGSIYILFKNGQVVKFSRGKPDDFSLKNSQDPITIPAQIYTSQNLKNIYVFDKDASNPKILVFDKEGVYQKQYQWIKLNQATGFVVDEEEKNILVGLDSIIFKISLEP